MRRVLVFALVVSLGNASALFAGESLAASGARYAHQIVQAETARPSTSIVSAPARAGMVFGKAPAAALLQAGQTPGTLEGSKMRKRTKVMIGLALGAAVAVSFWKIDHGVLDVTPSSLGTRKD